MFTLQDFKVKLVNGEEVKSFIKKHGEFAAVCYNTPLDRAEKSWRTLFKKWSYVRFKTFILCI